MQTKKHFWIKPIGVGALVAIGVYFYSQIATENISVTEPHTGQAQKQTLPNNKVAAVQTAQSEKTSNTLASDTSSSASSISSELHERLNAMNARRPNQSFNAADVAAAVTRTTTWMPSDTAHRELPLAEEEFTDGRQFIDLDSLKIETLMPGDQVNVRVSENARDYKVTIDRTEKHDYNSISWYGHIEGDDGQRYQVSFTRGEHLTVGGLDTPDGHFVLQAHGNKGWIASSQLLFKQDTTVSDAIHPADVDPNYLDHHTH